MFFHFSRLPSQVKHLYERDNILDQIEEVRFYQDGYVAVCAVEKENGFFDEWRWLDNSGPDANLYPKRWKRVRVDADDNDSVAA